MPSWRVARGLAAPLRAGLAVSLAVLLGAGSLPVRGADPARKEPIHPPYFAIRNARIVTVSGPVIENGTIVIRRGLITAVGESEEVSIPPEAWVIEGEGLSVYPGLIDSLTTLGLPAAGGAPGAGAQQAFAPPRQISQGPEDRPATMTWQNPADRLTLEDKRLETWRKAGFTSAVVAPDKGIFPGQAALINLAADRPREMVVKTPVALRINLQPLPGFWSFPSSLMGVLAYVKQVYLDARHYDQAWSLYENDPRGRRRPSYDRTLEPIRESLAENWPVLIPGNRTTEIRRALELGEDIDARTLLYGGHQGYEIAEELARNNIPVLVSLKWPEKPKDADPEGVTPLRVLRFRVNAPTTPAAFEQAGVRFAFYSDGLGSPTEIMKNARKAIEQGLSPEGALRAFTLSPAEIFGVADRLGSLEPGKIANLVVTDGDLFGEKTKVKTVFIDGRKFETREPGRPEEPPTVDLTGRWELTVSTPQGPQEMTAELTMEEDGTLTGTLISPRGERPLTSGWVSGNKFSFSLTITMGPRTLEATYTGTVEGNEMTGTVSMGPFSADFTGTRPERARARSDPGWRADQPGGRR